jgi:predicted RNA binding protein YcfA (HicA-like mRNA interferase family)
MKIPRDLSGEQLVRLLRKLDYQIVRQKGSHIRLTTDEPNQHHLTIPNHDPIKVGTLGGILSDIAEHKKMTKEPLLIFLFD